MICVQLTCLDNLDTSCTSQLYHQHLQVKPHESQRFTSHLQNSHHTVYDNVKYSIMYIYIYYVYVITYSHSLDVTSILPTAYQVMDPAPPLLDHLWIQAMEDVQTQGPCCIGRKWKNNQWFFKMDIFFPLPNLQTILSHAEASNYHVFGSYLGGPNAPFQGMFRGGDGAKTLNLGDSTDVQRQNKRTCARWKITTLQPNLISIAKQISNSCSYNRSYHLKNIKKHCISSIPLFVWKCALFCATLANSSILKGLGAVSAVSRQVFRSPRIRKLRRACRSFRAVSCYMRGERAQGWWRDRASVFSRLVDYYSKNILYIFTFFWRTPPSICLSINHESSQDLFTYSINLSLYQSTFLST